MEQERKLKLPPRPLGDTFADDTARMAAGMVGGTITPKELVELCIRRRDDPPTARTMVYMSPILKDRVSSLAYKNGLAEAAVIRVAIERLLDSVREDA